MLIVFIKLLLIVMAAVSNAIMDTSADHFEVSIFKGMNAVFWDKATAAKFSKFIRFTKWRCDAWHLFKSIMLLCFSVAIVLPNTILPWWAAWLIGTAVWILTFNLFYNKILRRKNA